MAKIEVQLTLGPRAIAAAAAVLALGVMVSEVSSESINLTTFYPSPAGVYYSMITTGQTVMARDSRGVTVGSTQGVQGTGKLVIPTGNVGIGTVNPSARLHVAGTQTFGDVTVNQIRGIDWVGGGPTNGGWTGWWYGIFREPGAWSGTLPSLALQWYTGVKLKAWGGNGGVSIYEDQCDNNQLSCAANGTGAGTEIARFRIDPYGGSYVNSRLGLGGYTTPSANIEVGGDGVMVLEEASNRCWVPVAPFGGGNPTCAGAGSGYYTASVSGAYSRSVAPGFSALCCECPYGSCP